MTIVTGHSENIFGNSFASSEHKRLRLQQYLIKFIDEKLKEIGRSRLWLSAMVKRELGLNYSDIEYLEQGKLMELCSYLDNFYITGVK